MPKYRVVFPSYDWDDVFAVNQIIQLPNVVDKEKIGFKNGVPQETVHASDAAIKRWIDDNMDGCSCLVLFLGEKTYLSKWVKYELELAWKKNLGRLIISLEGIRLPSGVICHAGPDPYQYHGMYSEGPGYVIRQYLWINNGVRHIGDWIEDACLRAGR